MGAYVAPDSLHFKDTPRCGLMCVCCSVIKFMMTDVVLQFVAGRGEGRKKV